MKFRVTFKISPAKLATEVYEKASDSVQSEMMVAVGMKAIRFAHEFVNPNATMTIEFDSVQRTATVVPAQT